MGVEYSGDKLLVSGQKVKETSQYTLAIEDYASSTQQLKGAEPPKMGPTIRALVSDYLARAKRGG